MKYNNLIFFIILIIFSILASGCSSSRGDFVTTISGKVLDSLSNDPIYNCNVYLGDFSDSLHIMNTNSSGEYVFSDFGYGPFTLRFLKEGYQIKAITIKGSDDKLTFDNVDIKLAPEITK